MIHENQLVSDKISRGMSDFDDIPFFLRIFRLWEENRV